MQSATLNKEPATYSLLQYDVNELGLFLGKPELHNWTGNHIHIDGSHMPIIFKNATLETLKNTSGLVVPPNTILLHPASDGLAVVGWRSPVSGMVSVTGSVGKLHYGNTAWSIDQGSTNLVSGNFDSVVQQSFQITNITVQKGEFIYFSLSPYDNLYGDSTWLDISIDVVGSKKCDDPAKRARYSYKTGRVDIPFTDVPLLEETSPNATGDTAVFKGLRLRLNANQDFEIIDHSAKPDDSGEGVGDPCHAVYTYENRTLKIPAVEVPTVLATFPTIKEGKPISVYQVLFQHIQVTPIDLGFLHLQEAQLIEVLE
jgi:hypothetical protein